MKYNKAKLKEQNSSRLTEPKNGLRVAKWKGTLDGWEGRDKGKRSITLSTHSVGVARERQYSTEKTSSVSIASFYADGQ